MLPSQVVLAKLSRRIEQAYGLRRPDWRGGCSTPRLWSAAAVRLWSTHAADPSGIPLDAELFVVSQPISVPFAYRSELTQPDCACWYRSQLRKDHQAAASRIEARGASSLKWARSAAKLNTS